MEEQKEKSSLVIKTQLGEKEVITTVNEKVDVSITDGKVEIKAKKINLTHP